MIKENHDLQRIRSLLSLLVAGDDGKRQEVEYSLQRESGLTITEAQAKVQAADDEDWASATRSTSQPVGLASPHGALTPQRRSRGNKGRAWPIPGILCGRHRG
jgi:hypothetical protein